MRNLTIASMTVLLCLLPSFIVAQEKGPADDLWVLYKQGQFEEVVAQGRVLLATDTETAQVNLAVGRSLVHLEKYDDAFPFLTKAVQMDPEKTWVYAWAQIYLGVTHYKLGDDDRASQAFILGRDCHATKNATRNAESNMLALGLSEFFSEWVPFETEHFSFRFSGRMTDFDRVEFARNHEDAYAVISKWFGGGPEEKIRFLLWSSQDEADEGGIGPLGFSKPDLFLTHAVVGQTIGHEMTHIISFHALNPTVRSGLINEGTAVIMDQTNRDQLKRARDLMQEETEEQIRVSIPAMWEDWSLAPSGYSYPVAGAFVAMLIEEGGKDKFLEFFVDQSYGHAQVVYGSDLSGWIEDFEEKLYQ